MGRALKRQVISPIPNRGGIEPKAARQYMAVAECFVLGLQLPVEELRKIAPVSMRVLVVAAKVATPDNWLQIVDIVSAMP
jgi:hypothetical protein